MLAAAGERIARQLPVAVSADDGMEWEDIGKGEEEDDFLVDWKAQVRNDVSHDNGEQKERGVHSVVVIGGADDGGHVSLLRTDVRLAAAVARQHGPGQQFRAGSPLSINLAAPHNFFAQVITPPRIHNSSKLHRNMTRRLPRTLSNRLPVSSLPLAPEQLCLTRL